MVVLEPTQRLMVPPNHRADFFQAATEPLSALAAPRGWPMHSHHLNYNLVNDTSSGAGVASTSDGLFLVSHNITFIVIGTVALLLLIGFTCCCCYRDRILPPRLPPAAFAEAKEASMGEHVGAYVISDKDATYTSDHHRTGCRDYTFTSSSIGLVLTDTALGAVRIDRVLPNSPANEQGIAPRSTIIAINAQSIRLSAAEVATLISTLPRPITLRLQDNELIWEDEASSQRFTRIQVVPRTGDNDFNYAVPVALSLFMRVVLEGALVFMALFMLSLLTIRDNLMRSEARAACRDAGSTVAGYQALTNLGNASKAELKHLEAKLKFPPAECGWDGLPIRRFQHASIWKVVQGSILGSSLGGCNEYRDCDTRVLARCDQVSGSDCVSLRVSCICLRLIAAPCSMLVASGGAADGHVRRAPHCPRCSRASHCIHWEARAARRGLHGSLVLGWRDHSLHSLVGLLDALDAAVHCACHPLPSAHPMASGHDGQGRGRGNYHDGRLCPLDQGARRELAPPTAVAGAYASECH